MQNNDGEGCRYRGVPFVQNETAQSYLFRIMDFWNKEVWDDTSTNAITKEIILTLLQCAARLYEGKSKANAAIDLIESTHTRAILSLGIRDALCRVVHQQYMGKIRSDTSVEERNAEENNKWTADLFSAIRRNEARRLNYRAMIFEHVSSLCYSHGTSLQNPFDAPRIDERFMFNNYVTLSKSFNRSEKSWLITLLPDIFKWEGHGSDDGTNRDGLLAPNFGATKHASSDASMATSSTPPSTVPNAIGVVDKSYDELVSPESVESLHWNFPWASGEPSRHLVAGERIPLSPGQASTTQRDQFWGSKPEIGASDLDFESLTLADRVSISEKWTDFLKQGGTVTSSQDPLMSQDEATAPISIKIKGKDVNCHKEWEGSVVLPSSNISDDDWDLLGSGDDGASIFRFSPDASNNSANGALPSNSVEDTDRGRSVRRSSAKDAQQALSSVSFPPFQSINRHVRERSNMLEPAKWMRSRKNANRLAVIAEELQGKIEVEDRCKEFETAFKKRAP